MSDIPLPSFDLPDISEDYSIIVLLVDDQAMVGEMVRRSLAKEANIVFHYCSDGLKALATAERIRPTVILQDLLMPDVDGLTLLRQYRTGSLTKNVPVVVLSMKDEPKTKSDAFRLGATDYLVKLPDPVELIARIRHHSKAYSNQIQRDQAYHALHASQQQLIEMNIELQRLTSIDGLTGLANRRYMDEFLATEWKRAQREKSDMSVVMMDVDNFKLYNDTYGHLAGDDVLKRVATMIKQGVERPADLAARFGGEEFILILPGTNLEGASHVAQSIRALVGNLNIPHSAATSASHVTISMGVATTIPVAGVEVADLIARADASLYEAKHSGRNCVRASTLPAQA